MGQSRPLTLLFRLPFAITQDEIDDIRYQTSREGQTLPNTHTDGAVFPASSISVYEDGYLDEESYPL